MPEPQDLFFRQHEKMSGYPDLGAGLFLYLVATIAIIAVRSTIYATRTARISTTVAKKLVTKTRAIPGVANG